MAGSEAPATGESRRQQLPPTPIATAPVVDSTLLFFTSWGVWGAAPSNGARERIYGRQRVRRAPDGSGGGIDVPLRGGGW